VVLLKKHNNKDKLEPAANRASLMQLTFITRSHRDTVSLGTSLGRVLEHGSVIGLVGDLGAGKTCFIKGVACGISNVDENEVTSPTFTIVQEYAGEVPLYHFDAYRLSGSEDLEDIGFNDYLGESGVTVVEWADRISSAFPKDCLLINVDIVGENKRSFIFRASGLKHEKILEQLQKGNRQTGNS